ncbi:aminopeptidase N [Nasonia vitripennis]|uniref:Aminopeptidase n=1 Tax=Nasonia vitripennis TaxID=7425 RepID=A0A7M7G9M1_NASVI|nr:aminopeptidase N [Nasonia vitripennis]
MRRGSVVTYADDGRRHSAGMVTPESYRSNNRQEFTVNDIGYERTGGCFVSYRKIAFAFVFLLAVAIAAAFIVNYLGSQSDKDTPDALTILSKEEETPEKYVLAPSIKPQRYRIELIPIPDLDRDRVKLKGRVVIEFTHIGSGEPTSQLVLNSRHLTIESHRVVVLGENNSTKKDDEDGDLRIRSKRDANETRLEQLRLAEEPSFVTELKIAGNKSDELGGLYVIFLEKALADGNYSLEIEYEASLDGRVIFVENFRKNDEERLLLVSRLKPVNAPRLFPTLDEAKLKANFVLTLEHPRDSRVFSNTALMNSSDSGTENQTSAAFGETRRISAHNLAFVIGAEIESLGQVPITEQQSLTYWADPGRKSQEYYLRDKLDRVLSAFAELFQGVSLPSDKLDLLALPIDFEGISAPGLIVVRDSLFHVAANSPAQSRAEALLNLIGLVGQQWLGGLVDAKNWTDAWFAEGSTRYLQQVLLDKIDQSLGASDDFLIDVQMEAMENDGYKVSKALEAKVNRTRVEAFDLEDNYSKGACLIRMLHGILSEQVFRTGYVDFLRRWSYESTDSAEFLRSLAGNTTIELDSKTIKLNEAFADWTRKPGYPLVNVTWLRDNGTVAVRQTKFNFDDVPRDEDEEEEEEGAKIDEDTALWWVPLTYVTVADGNWTEPSVAWLKGNEEMTLANVDSSGNASWIVVNVNRTGYYRVNYDETTWRALTSALRDKHEDFPVATRASLIDDALSIARQGSLSYDTALELLDYLGPSERSYAPWAALARHAMELDFALYETPAYPNFQDFMRRLVAKLFDEMEPKIEEGSQLAMLAMRLACMFEHQKCTSWAKTKWEDVFKNNKENTLASHVRETVYCVGGAQHGGKEELSYLMKKFEESKDREEKDRLLSALGCFQTPWILQKILNEILESDKYEDNDIKVILQSYTQNPAAAQAARRFVQENWKEIVKRFSNSYWTMKAFVEASTSLLFTERDLNEFNTFRDVNIESLKLMGHWVALNEMKASSWIFRLKESSGSIQRWLKNHANSTV